jgi:hypothetical protein
VGSIHPLIIENEATREGGLKFSDVVCDVTIYNVLIAEFLLLQLSGSTQGDRRLPTKQRIPQNIAICKADLIRFKRLIFVFFEEYGVPL